MRFPLFFSALCALVSSPLSAQDFRPLDFSQNVQQPNATYPAGYSTVGPHYYNGPTFDFRNVTTFNGRSVDARASFTGISGNYQFDGWVPHYNGPVTGNTNYGYADNGLESDRGNDLGLFYHAAWPLAGDTSGGVSWSLSFYEGGGAFETLVTLDSIALLFYDHDGDPEQSETVRLHTSDGFAGYMIHGASGITAQNEGGGSFRFDARGSNLSETTAEGGFIAHYQNVSTIHVDMLSTTLTSIPQFKHGILLAIDGDLDLVNPAEFSIYQAVPEPSSSLLAVTLSGLFLWRRKR